MRFRDRVVDHVAQAVAPKRLGHRPAGLGVQGGPGRLAGSHLAGARSAEEHHFLLAFQDQGSLVPDKGHSVVTPVVSPVNTGGVFPKQGETIKFIDGLQGIRSF